MVKYLNFHNYNDSSAFSGGRFLTLSGMELLSSFSAESSSFVVGTVVVLVRNCRLLCPKAFCSFCSRLRCCTGAAAFFLLRFSFLFPVGTPRAFRLWRNLYLSRTVKHWLSFSCGFCFCFCFLFFVFLPTSIPFACCCLEDKNKMSCSRVLLASLLQFASALSFFSSRCCFLFFEFFSPFTFMQWKALLTYTYP